MQTEVAQLAAPDRVVAQGIALGLTAPAQVVNLPEVPLDVPLPVPQTRCRSGARHPPRPPPGAADPVRHRAATAPPATAGHRRPRPPTHGDDARPVSPAVLLSRRTRAMRLLLVAVFGVMILRLVQVQEFGNQHYAALSAGPAHPGRHRAAGPRRHLRPQRRGPGRDGDPPDRGGRPADHHQAGRRGRGAVARCSGSRPTPCGPS